jgi:phosphoribosylamine---glycine ligase
MSIAMKILVVGNGGREHAICRALSTSRPKPMLLIAPGNPGTATLGENCNVSADDVKGLVDLAVKHQVDLVVVGPEGPLVAGIGDALAAVNILCCGPGLAAARLEGSKAFTRDVTSAVGVPSPRYGVYSTLESLRHDLETWNGVPVVKADGLAAGKGVFLPDSKAECFEAAQQLFAGVLGQAGQTVVLEDRLVGVEASLFYACNGLAAVALPHARDHKRIFDGDEGPNTGGMGAISPNPLIDAVQDAVRLSSLRCVR